MEQIFELLSSPAFRSSLYWLGISAFMLSVGAVVIAFAFYGRAKEAQCYNAENGRWVLLLATWRDSLIITILFVAEGLLYRFSDLTGLSEVMAPNPYLYAPLVQPIADMILLVLIFTVAVMRVIAISQWLSEQGRQKQQ